MDGVRSLEGHYGRWSRTLTSALQFLGSCSDWPLNPSNLLSTVLGPLPLSNAISHSGEQLVLSPVVLLPRASAPSRLHWCCHQNPESV